MYKYKPLSKLEGQQILEPSMFTTCAAHSSCIQRVRKPRNYESRMKVCVEMWRTDFNLMLKIKILHVIRKNKAF